MSVLLDIRSLHRDQLATSMAALGAPAFRLDQLLDWLYPKSVAHWDEMSNVPLPIRRALATQWSLQLPECVQIRGASDTTRKFLWRLRDGALIESVLIPASPALYGEPSDRQTLCVSTQVGCAYGCRFCASGLGGWKRNLTADEIIGQVVAVERWHRRGESGGGAVECRVLVHQLAEASEPARAAKPAAPARFVSNLVVMGMGEPLANCDALLQALRILNAPWGLQIGARKMTISTSGLVPEILRLAREPHQFGLALSLHGATDEVRNRLMPVNRKYPVAELVAAGAEFLRAKGRTITLEYILIAGVNDDLQEVRPLAAIARQLHAKVNLIPYNRVQGLAWERPSEGRQRAFLDALTRLRVRATLRREKGHEIDAACGQLRLRTERGLAAAEGTG